MCRRAAPVRVGHHLGGDVRRRLPEPTEHPATRSDRSRCRRRRSTRSTRTAECLHAHQHRRRRHSREHGEAERRAADYPDAKIQTEAQFIEGQEQGPEHLPEPALRPARAVDHRQPVRHREHARPDRVRAHARARDAPRRRDDPAAGAPHDPPRVGDHGADRRRARDPARLRARDLFDRRSAIPALAFPWSADGRLHRRRDHRRLHRRDLPGAARIAAQRAERASVR